jgi:hypothetical protein
MRRAAIVRAFAHALVQTVAGDTVEFAADSNGNGGGQDKRNGTVRAGEAHLHKVWRGITPLGDGAVISRRAAPVLASRSAAYATVRCAPPEYDRCVTATTIRSA